MVTRDLRFNIFANDRASAAFAAASEACDRLSSRLTALDRKRVAVKIEADTKPLEAKLAQAEAQLDELNRKRADPKIDADIALAQAKMVRLATQLQELNKGRTQAKIDADTTAAQERLKELQARLAELGRGSSSPKISLETFQVRQQITEVEGLLQVLGKEKVNPEITLRTAEIEAQMAKVQARIEELNRMKASPKIDADIGAAEAKILMLKAQIEDLRRTGGIKISGKDAERDANSLLGVLNRIGERLLVSVNAAGALARNMRALSIPVSIASMIPSIASLGDTLMTASQAMLLLPAAAGFAAAAIGTLAFAFNGLSDAIGPRDTAKQIEKADLAMSRLGKSAQEVAKQVIAFKPAWNDLKKAVQESVFEGLAKTLESLGKTYLPVLKTGFVGLGHEINNIAGNLNAFLREGKNVDDVTRLFSLWEMTLASAGPGLTNITAALMDMGVVGSSFLPGLGQAFTDLTAKFAVFIDKARESGDLELWIAQGIIAIKELGTLVGNLGSIFGAVFEAARKSGSSLVETLNSGLSKIKEFLQSGQGQAGMIALFQGIRDAVDSLMPGLRAIGGAFADAFVIIQPAIHNVGAAISAFAAAIAPTAVTVAQLATDIAGPLSQAVIFLSNAFSGVLPIVLSLSLAFRALTSVGAIFLSIGAAVKGLATTVGMAGLAIGASGVAAQTAATATAGLGNALMRVGNSLPLIGAAVIGLVMAYDAFSSKSDELSNSVVKGSMSIATAIAAEQAQVEKNVVFWGLGLDKKKEYAEAAKRVTDGIYAELQALDPLARAQAEVTIAEGNLNDQMRIHGERSAEATTAADILKGAKERLTSATEQHANMTRTDTEAIIANAQETAAAANADVGLERAKITLEQQVIRTTDALKKHTASSLEGRTALVDLMDANLRVAEAAQRKAEADAKARGEADSAKQGAQAYADTLINLASTATGPTRAALLGLIANLDTTKSGANNASLAAAGLKDDVDKIPKSQATAFSQPGMDKARSDVKGLQSDVDNLKDRKFTITATGEVKGSGMTGLATGGILPGYTPGRDVHTFSSPTGGVLGLSGGEAVMRPEWTRAMGTGYIEAANAAARHGGIAGVAEFLARTGPRDPGMEGRLGDGSRYATGGVIGQLNQATQITSPTSYTWKGPTITQWFDQAAAAIMKSYGGNALAWARTQVGKPYIWGGVGPGGYDCSGFMSAIVNVIHGKNPYSRVGATGNFPWGGFSPGIGPGLSIGAFTGNPGHMAGTINGTNVESSGGVGVRVGGGARGASDGMFNIRAHLPFDRGGIANHRGWMRKNTNRPERVLSPYQTNSFERLVRILDTVRTGQRPPRGVIGGTVSVTEITRMRSDLAGLGETIRAAMLNSRPITVEDRSGNPVETGRAVSLALRL